MSSKQSGISTIAVVIAGVALTFTIGGAYVYSQVSQSSAQQSATREEVKSLGQSLEQAQSGESTDYSDITPEQKQELQQQVEQMTREIMAREECDLDLDDFRDALEALIEAEKLSMEELAQELFDWVKDNLRDNATKASEYWPDTFLDKVARGVIDGWAAGTHAVRKGERESIPTIQDKATYQELALMLGMEDLFDDITSNNLIPPSEDEDSKCDKGYYTSLVSEGENTDLKDIDRAWTMNLNIYTCDENPLNAIWKGSWTWSFNALVKEEKKTFNPASSGYVEFVTSNGYGEMNLGGGTVPISINTTRAEASFTMHNLNTIELDGIVKKGASACTEEQKSL